MTIATISKGMAEYRTCRDCGNRIRWHQMPVDHAPGCVILMTDPKTDRERAQVLAVRYEQRAQHNPEAAETAELLRKLR